MNHDTPAQHWRRCDPRDGSDTIKIDPEFQNLIPPLTSTERAELRRKLTAEGSTKALLLWLGHDDAMVDGHNRLRDFREQGIPFWVEEREFADREAVKAFIKLEHHGRRNLSPAAQSDFRGERYLEMKRQGSRTDLTLGGNDPKSRTSARLGKEYHVGEKTVRRDAKVKEALDRIEKTCPGARNLLLSRDAALTQSRILHLADSEPEEQAAFIEALRTTGKPLRRAREGEKKTIALPREPRALAQALLKRLSPEDIAQVGVVLAEGAAQQDSRDAQAAAPEGSGERNGEAAT